MKSVFKFIPLLFFLAFITPACSQEPGQGVSNLDAKEFNEKMKSEKGVILDVRTPGEYAEGHIKGSELLDFTSGEFSSRIGNYDTSATYFVYCRSGNRSGQAVRIMQEKGFTRIYHLNGGINSWAGNGLPLEK